MLPPRLTVDAETLSRLKSLELKARLIVEGFITGLHKSPYHGFSVEFAEHRAFNPGENPRTIDWKVYGRTERLFTKKYEEETNLRCHLVVDASDSMRYPTTGTSKLLYAAQLAAALAQLMVRQRDAVGLTLFDEHVTQYLPPRARPAWLQQLYGQLEAALAAEGYFRRQTNIAQVLHDLIPKLGRRALVVIMSDMLGTDQPSLFSALQHLRHNKHEVLMFQVLERSTEEGFELPNQPLVVKDMETGLELRIRPELVREQYVTQMAAHLHSLRKRARELGIDLVETDIRQPYSKALLDYLIKRRKLVG